MPTYGLHEIAGLLPVMRKQRGLPVDVAGVRRLDDARDRRVQLPALFLQLRREGHFLAEREARICSRIVDELPLAQSTVSEHLRILKSAGLVRVNEKGPQVGYCIVPAALKRVKALLNAM